MSFGRFYVGKEEKISVGSMEKSDRRFLIGTLVGEFARDCASTF